MILWTITDITYNRRAFDRGVILATRKYKSEFARTQKPCQVFDGGARISFHTPHKRNMSVFVPAAELQAGKVLTWLHYVDGKSHTVETTARIVEVTAHHAALDVLSEEIKVFPRRRRHGGFQPRPGKAKFTLLNNPFLPDARADRFEVPDRIIYQGRHFASQTNFCFIFDPAHKKRAGSPFRRVRPEEVQKEVFRYNFEPYDVLTGRKLGPFLEEVRQEHFQEGLKPTPAWREV